MQNIDQDNTANLIKPPDSIGKTSFRRVSTKSYYVDKTLLIKDVIDKEELVTLFTRPNLFGKTLNMDMLKVFFEIKNKDTSKYFYDKNIWKCGNIYQNHQGKYPVIHLTFKDTKLASWNEVYNAILKVIQEEFFRHKVLEDSSNLDDNDKEIYKTYSSNSLLPSESFNALAVLSELLFNITFPISCTMVGKF